MQRLLTADNIDEALEAYVSSVDEVELGTATTKLKLLHEVKRGKVGSGPYPNVSFFEAANRIMTDMVLLHGIRWVLRESGLAYRSYRVEYGNEDANDHDIIAETPSQRLHGEAFNVSKSLFQLKKGKMLKKLRANGSQCSELLIIVNLDAVEDGYRPKMAGREMMLLVDVFEEREPKLWGGCA